jgi:hypothetical protein
MTEIKIGKAVLKIDMHIPNPQGYLSYQAANELQLQAQYNQEWMEEAEKEIKRLSVDNTKVDGIMACINALRSLQNRANHTRKWSHSNELKFAPVELSDWLLINVLREEMNLINETDKMLNMDTSALHKKS